MSVTFYSYLTRIWTNNHVNTLVCGINGILGACVLLAQQVLSYNKRLHAVLSYGLDLMICMAQYGK